MFNRVLDTPLKLIIIRNVGRRLNIVKQIWHQDFTVDPCGFQISENTIWFNPFHVR